MNVDGELAMDRATYRRAVLSTAKPPAWAFRAIGVLTIVCGGWIFVGNPNLTTILEVVFGLVIVFFPEILVDMGWRRLGAAAGRTFHYTVTDRSVTIRTPESTVSLQWEGVTRVRLRPHAWVIRAAGGSVLIPRAAFTPQAQADIDRFLAAHR